MNLQGCKLTNLQYWYRLQDCKLTICHLDWVKGVNLHDWTHILLSLVAPQGDRLMYSKYRCTCRYDACCLSMCTRAWLYVLQPPLLLALRLSRSPSLTLSLIPLALSIIYAYYTAVIYYIYIYYIHSIYTICTLCIVYILYIYMLYTFCDNYIYIYIYI